MDCRRQQIPHSCQSTVDASTEAAVMLVALTLHEQSSCLLLSIPMQPAHHALHVAFPVLLWYVPGLHGRHSE